MAATATERRYSMRDRAAAVGLASLAAALDGSPGGLDGAGVRRAMDAFGREGADALLRLALRTGRAIACREMHAGAPGRDRWVYFAGPAGRRGKDR